LSTDTETALDRGIAERAARDLALTAFLARFPSLFA